MSVKDRPGVLVVGDVCLDVVGLPKSMPTGSEVPQENWRQTGELRTHYLPGGAMLLAKFIRDARQAARLAELAANKSGALSDTTDWERLIAGPRPMPPPGLGKAEPLGEEAFIAIAPRLSREEVLHSIIGAESFPTTSNPDDKSTVPRVRHEHGYSGPAHGNPTLEVRYEATGQDRFVVISDTGNQIRYRPDAKRFNEEVLKGAVQVVYKLHRPLPDAARENVLWNLAKAARQPDNAVVVIDVEDLRAEEIPISQGLSWERTALDVVWHFLNVERLSELRDCPALIVRLGLDGAMLWRRTAPTSKDTPPFEAWIVYDPGGIEGTLAATVLGRMVGLGSAFTAAVVENLAEASITPVDARKPAPDRATTLIEAIKSGLLAARRLLATGFVEEAETKDLHYPGPALFKARDEKDKDVLFAHQVVPIIQGAVQPDRAYWRLLDATFEGTGRLQEAVELLATSRKGAKAQGSAQALLDASPRAKFGNLTTFDRREIEHYRSLYTLLRDYLRAPNPSRPLSVAVFGPPGAGKSFGVKEVGKSLKGQPGCKDVEALTFNLSLYRTPDDLAGAFHLVRDVVLRGKVPLVFFDEFDTSLDGLAHGWLRHFLAPMQDGEFLDREAPHPIGPAIFVFAGGTCATFAKFENQTDDDKKQKFVDAKGPDFISRLRATLDIPSLNLAVAFHHDTQAKPGDVVTSVALLLKAQGLETFDAYGPIEALPSRAAVLLRRAGILAFNLPKKAPGLVRADKSLAVTKPVLRALMHLPQFHHGNRSFEALLDMSHLDDAAVYTPARLPAPFQTTLHADSAQLSKLVGTDYPFPEADRELIARAIHKQYLEDNKSNANKTRAYVEWDKLVDDDRAPNFEQADDIATKLRTAGLWFRKRTAVDSVGQGVGVPDDLVELLAVLEHDRWAAQKRRQGWAPAAGTEKEARKNPLLLHNCLFPWNALSEKWWNLDRTTVRAIPEFLAAAGYEVFKP